MEDDDFGGIATEPQPRVNWPKLAAIAAIFSGIGFGLCLTALVVYMVLGKPFEWEAPVRTCCYVLFAWAVLRVKAGAESWFGVVKNPLVPDLLLVFTCALAAFFTPTLLALTWIGLSRLYFFVRILAA